MARIRTIKPEFFTSLTVADLTPEQRLTFIGLWTHVDDAGRCVDDPRLIKAAIWPLDDRTAADIEIDLKALTESSLITRYGLNRKRYLAVTNWEEHQRINRPTESKLPAPEEGDLTPPDPVTRRDVNSLSTHAHLTEDSPQERKGKERNREGKGTPLPPADGTAEAAPAAGAGGIPDQMLASWWDKFGRRTAQSKKSVRQAIADALANGNDPDELWAALLRLGEVSKPVTGGTLQFAFSEIRKSATGADVIPFRDRQQQATDDLFDRAMARAQARTQESS
ncbi:hypothetical protein [Streptomyces sp. NPDC004230]